MGSSGTRPNPPTPFSTKSKSFMYESEDKKEDRATEAIRSMGTKDAWYEYVRKREEEGHVRPIATAVRRRFFETEEEASKVYSAWQVIMNKLGLTYFC